MAVPQDVGVKVDPFRGKLYRVTTKTFCCYVGVLDNIIVDAAPILRKFVGQSLGNLRRWISKLGGTVDAHDPSQR